VQQQVTIVLPHPAEKPVGCGPACVHSINLFRKSASNAQCFSCDVAPFNNEQ